MTLLILGLLLWTGAHYFKRLMPARRAAMGDKGRGPVAIAIVLSVVMMVMGYDPQSSAVIWNPPAFMMHINNALMLLALWVFGSSAAKGAKVWPANKIRHPMLTAVKIWAVAHLLVNGELAAIVLFGGLLAWAVGSVILINRSEPAWTAPPTAEFPAKMRLLVITLVMFAAVTAIHVMLNRWPFPS
ncbi:MAG: NnrU family protein [Sulfitobacter sp.]